MLYLIIMAFWEPNSHREFMEAYNKILLRLVIQQHIVLVNRDISPGSFYLGYFSSNLWAKSDI